jgi:hypothetical protein
MQVSTIARSSAVSMAREAIKYAEQKNGELAQKRLASACYYADQTTTDDDRETAAHYVGAAEGAMMIHCPEWLEN